MSQLDLIIFKPIIFIVSTIFSRISIEAMCWLLDRQVPSGRWLVDLSTNIFLFVIGRLVVCKYTIKYINVLAPNMSSHNIQSERCPLPPLTQLQREVQSKDIGIIMRSQLTEQRLTRMDIYLHTYLPRCTICKCTKDKLKIK